MKVYEFFYNLRQNEIDYCDVTVTMRLNPHLNPQSSCCANAY